MSIITTTSGVSGMLPSEYGELVERPVREMSVAFEAATEVNTSSNAYRIPVLTGDPVTGAVAEGAEIAPSDAAFTEIVVVPAKFAGLTVVSREMADDSSPSVGDTIGKAIARSIANSVDAALFNALGGVNPDGLADLAGISTVEAPAVYADLDPFASALSLSEANGGSVTAWVMNAAEALDLAQLKDETGSNRSLLNADLTVDGKRQLLGRPILVSPNVPTGTVYGISKLDMLTIVRTGTQLDVDKSAFFTSDRVAIKGTMRVGFAFPTPAAHVRITHAAA